jgi:hypothetical protein
MDYLRDLVVDGDNIKINLKEIECEGVDWFQLAQYRIYFKFIFSFTKNFMLQTLGMCKCLGNGPVLIYKWHK